MIGPDKVYAARMMSWSSLAGQKVWKVTFPDGTVTCRRKGLDDGLTHIYKCGKGVIKIPRRSLVELVGPVGRPDSYAKVYEIIERYGLEATIYLLGFDESSYGDQYPIAELTQFEKWGQSYVDWLEQIAAIDGQIASYFIMHGTEFRHFGSYDLTMWKRKRTNDAMNPYETAFNKSPFLGSYIQVIMMGVVWMPYPILDTIKWMDNLRELVRKFIPKHKQVVRDLTMISRICSKESAKWVVDNLALTDKTEYKPDVQFNWTIPEYDWSKQDEIQTGT